MHRSASRPIQVAEDILSIAELKAHLSQVVRELRERRRTVVITQKGKPAAVVVSPEEYDRLCHQARFLSAINEGLEDLASGRVLSDQELGVVLDERYGPLPARQRR
jgi:prevent-host-death family protein